MSIKITPTDRGYHYTCDCGDPDILTPADTGDDDYYCLNCGASRSIQWCREASRRMKEHIEAVKQDHSKYISNGDIEQTEVKQ